MALTTIIPNTQLPFAKPQAVSHIKNGISSDVNGVRFPLQVGVPVQNIYTFKVIPSAESATAVVTNQTFGTTESEGGFLPINTIVKGSGTDIHSKPIIFLGEPGILLDCERCLSIYFSAATTATTVITATGYDYRGVAIKWTSPVIVATTTEVVISVPFSVITSFYFNGNPFLGAADTPNISVGTNSSIGLPYFLKNASYIISAVWNNATPISADGGGIAFGYDWRTRATIDSSYSPRGFVNVGATVPDGSIMLVITYYVYGSDSELNAEIANFNQSSLKIVGVQTKTSSPYPNPTFVLPYLVEQDLVGVQLNSGGVESPGGGGDMKFFEAYSAAVLS